MKKKQVIPIIMALAYWIPATMHLYSDSAGSNTFLVPGCILGFILGYKGEGGIVLGQLITLIILFFIARFIYNVITVKKE